MIDTRNFPPPTGGPAFPTQRVELNNEGVVTGFAVMADGMTLRDWFAGKAMLAIMGSDRYTGVVGVNNYVQSVSRDAYKMADAMLEARK